MADDNEFIVGLLQSIQSNIAERGRCLDRMDSCLTGIEDRMARMESRQTSMMHFHQSVLVELTGINERLDNMTAQLMGIDRRVSAFEARS